MEDALKLSPMPPTVVDETLMLIRELSERQQRVIYTAAAGMRALATLADTLDESMPLGSFATALLAAEYQDRLLSALNPSN